MKTVPFWTDHYPRPETLTISSLPTQVDVVIVGGGYTHALASGVSPPAGTMACR
jgi:hypothetical protein